MNELPAVRGLASQLASAGINALLLNIHEAPGSQLLERFGFRSTPTFIVYAADGREVLRSSHSPTLDEILTAVE
jgi:hypothetical protein